MIFISLRLLAVCTLALVLLIVSRERVYAQISSPNSDILWAPLRTRAVARLTVTCKQAVSTTGLTSSVATGFIVGRYYLLSARHVLLLCSEQPASITADLSPDDLLTAEISATKNTQSILLEYDDGTNESLQAPVKIDALGGRDIAWIELRHNLKPRPSLCISNKLRFDPSEAVSFYGYGSGGPGHGVVTTITDDQDQDHLAEAADPGGPGYSGAPVVDERGYVKGVVAAFQNGNAHAQFVALSWASDFLRNSGWYATGAVPEDDLRPEDNHAKCEVRSAGPEKYLSITKVANDTDWRGGGSDPTKECLARINQLKASGPLNAVYQNTEQREDHRRVGLNHDEYRYYCTIVIMADPVYPVRRDLSCPMRDPVSDPLACQ